MTQEHIMKRRMIRAVALFGVTFIALVIFIGLYIDEKRRVQETYRKQFISFLEQTSDDIDSYLDNEGDLPLRYRRILVSMGNADCFAFLMENLTEEQKITVNELYTCVIKYPEQMQDKERLEKMKTAVSDMSENLDKGFEEAKDVVNSIDKKGL